MNLRLIGALCVILGCGGIGFHMAREQIRQERMVRELISVLDFMERELQYRLSPLPQLCRQAAEQGSGMIHKAFLVIAEELESQISPDAEHCVRAAMGRMKHLPEAVDQIFLQISRCFGRFELQGQLKALESVREECNALLEKLLKNKDSRLRSYQTLGLCAGAAIVILFI